MKKILLLVVLILIALTTMCSASSNGDIAGNIYYTDIKTTMYTAPINALNIGGRTVIDAEALNWHYGFDVYWLNDERKLDITDKGGIFVSLQAVAGETLDELKGKPGGIAGNFYHTDIKTYLNGKEIESYNIGGRTFIVAENMREFGYAVDWNEKERTLKISKNINFYTSESELGNINLLYHPLYKVGSIFAFEVKRGVTVDNNEGMRYEIATPSNSIMLTQSGLSYVALSDIREVFQASCSLNETIETIYEDSDTKYQKCKYIIELHYDANMNPDRKEFASIDCESFEVEFSEAICESISYNDVRIHINGEDIGVPSFYADKSFQSDIIVVDGKIYVPTQVIAKMLNCYSAM